MWEKERYGDAIADIYDERHEELFDKAATVRFLTERAQDGPALELAIGTGRIALPLRGEGVEVHGIDISSKMVEKLRAKPGGNDIQVTMGDFADVDVEGKFPLIFIVFNSFFALTSQEEQIRCLRNVAAHLTDDGRFVVELFVPDVARFERHQNVEVTDVEVDRVFIHVARHDPVNQTIQTQQILISESETKLFPVFLRYTYPSELDVMAEVAGLGLRERYGDWRGAPFTSRSASHISVYGLR